MLYEVITGHLGDGRAVAVNALAVVDVLGLQALQIGQVLGGLVLGLGESVVGTRLVRGELVAGRGVVDDLLGLGQRVLLVSLRIVYAIRSYYAGVPAVSANRPRA